jgi:hypothetical protein
MNESQKNIAVYLVIAVVIVGASVAYLRYAYNPQYNLKTVILNETGASGPYPYQNLSFQIAVENTGGAQLTQVPVNLYINNTLYKSYKVSIPPSKAAVIDFNYTYLNPGQFDFVAVADPAHILNLDNRSAATASTTVNVLIPQTPNVYTSIPNVNVSNTTAFSLTQAGVSFEDYLGAYYNVSTFNRILGPSRNIVLAILTDFNTRIGNVNGATATYSNGSSATTLWMQGIISLQEVNQVVLTFRLPTGNTTINGIPTTFVKVSNSTSMCIYYLRGWTRLLTYYNASTKSTCATLEGMNISATLNTTLSDAVKNNSVLSRFRTGFVYVNSTYLGSALTMSGNALGFINIFGNQNDYFASQMTDYKNQLNSSKFNLTCFGLLYTNGSDSACSVFVRPSDSSIPYSLINTTDITKNYITRLYSLVNISEAVDSHDNAVSLIGALDLNQSSFQWLSPYQSSCGIYNLSVNCTFTAFNFSSNIATFSLTNKLQSTLKIRDGSCYQTAGLGGNQTINESITAGASENVTLTCYNVPIPIASAIKAYTLSLNYTTGGKGSTAYGFFNFS